MSESYSNAQIMELLDREWTREDLYQVYKLSEYWHTPKEIDDLIISSINKQMKIKHRAFGFKSTEKDVADRATEFVAACVEYITGGLPFNKLILAKYSFLMKKSWLGRTEEEIDEQYRRAFSAVKWVNGGVSPDKDNKDNNE